MFQTWQIEYLILSYRTTHLDTMKFVFYVLVFLGINIFATFNQLQEKYEILHEDWAKIKQNNLLKPSDWKMYLLYPVI